MLSCNFNVVPSTSTASSSVYSHARVGIYYSAYIRAENVDVGVGFRRAHHRIA